jgi:hypothetical protein
MRSWLAIVIGTSAAVAVSAIPPTAFEMPRPEQLPEQARLEALQLELIRGYWKLEARQWSEWVSALAVRSDPRHIAFGPPTSGDVTPEGVADWERTYVRALEELRPRDLSVRFGVFWRSAADTRARSLAYRDGPLLFAGMRDGLPYCFVVIAYLYASDSDLRSSFEEYGLGPCRLYAQYGMPGTGIGDWLEAGAWGFAARSEPAPDFRGLRDQVGTRTAVFGTARHPLAGGNLAVQACLAGDAGACTRAVSEPALIGPVGPFEANVGNATSTAFDFENPASMQPPFSYLDDSLLADVESEFGQEAFARFWSSDQPVVTAFSNAFGVELGAWVLDWVESRTGLYRAGPELPLGSLWLSLLALAGLSAIGCASAIKRRVA